MSDDQAPVETFTLPAAERRLVLMLLEKIPFPTPEQKELAASAQRRLGGGSPT
jgi:hypothetical protein